MLNALRTITSSGNVALRRGVLATLGLTAAALPLVAVAAPVDLPHTFSDGGIISAEEFNDNFDAIASAVDDNDDRISLLEGSESGAPTGAVMFFNLADCPEGWVVLEALQGRVPVGLPSGGQLAQTQGSAFDDLGTRTISQVPTHSHSAGTLGTSAVPNHSHTVTQGGSHSHPLSGTGNHSHTINNMGEGGGFSWRPHWSGTTQPAAGSYTTPSGGGHSHTVQSAGQHGHGLSSAGGHGHSISGNTGNNAGGVASVDVTMPYIQLLACEKQ